MRQKTSTHKTGLGFDPYAHSKTHAPNVVKPLGTRKFEIANERKNMIFKSAGIMSSTNQVNTNVASTSQVKHKVKYTCTHCGKDGHLVVFCFRLAKQQRKEKAKAMSNFTRAQFVPREVVSPFFVHRVNQTPFVDRNTSKSKSEFFHKNTCVMPTRAFSRVSQYWIPNKCFMTNPSTKASTSCNAM